ncbi:MAG: glycosyltransferase family 2 protein [Acidobacteria bacterium]|nr:glycosyltransferase family 2 protein [Acidobacteriota bacterium]
MSTKEANKKPSISVVIPVFNEQRSLEELHARLSAVLPQVTSRHECIFIDDGSRDRSYRVLQQIRQRDPTVRLIQFRRNFGKSAALSAGFTATQFDLVITLDADLQDLPEEIPKLLATLEQGYDLVSGWRHRRQDLWSKRLASKIYNVTTAKLTGTRLHDFNCGFKVYRREVLDELRVYGERHRYIPVLASYRGFRIGEVTVEHEPRRYGESKFGWDRFLGGFFTLLTVILLTRYTNRPLHFFGIMGLITALVGLVIDGYLAVERLLFKKWLGDRPLLLLGTLLLIIGVQFIFFGLLAEMIASTYRRDHDYSIIESVLETEPEPDQEVTATGAVADNQPPKALRFSSGAED